MSGLTQIPRPPTPCGDSSGEVSAAVACMQVTKKACSRDSYQQPSKQHFSLQESGNNRCIKEITAVLQRHHLWNSEIESDLQETKGALQPRSFGASWRGLALLSILLMLVVGFSWMSWRWQFDPPV